MRSSSVYDIAFLVGLICGVRVMVAGVERDGGGVGIVVRTRWAVLAGSFALAGLTGALLARTTLSPLVVGVSALVAGIVGGWAARLLVRQALSMPVSDHEFDPRFALQGVPATVVEAIPETGTGLVRLPASGGAPVLVAARSLDGSPIARDVEVAVERIDEGVAFVESWATIEARL